MKLKNALIAWNPVGELGLRREAGPGAIKVDSLALNWATRWDKPYFKTSGGCYSHVKEFTDIEARHFVLSTFVGIVVGDGVDPQAAHREFMKIDEYRAAIPPDMEGAST